jgi:hypothetical protein
MDIKRAAYILYGRTVFQKDLSIKRELTAATAKEKAEARRVMREYQHPIGRDPDRADYEDDGDY